MELSHFGNKRAWHEDVSRQRICLYFLLLRQSATVHGVVKNSISNFIFMQHVVCDLVRYGEASPNWSMAFVHEDCKSAFATPVNISLYLS